jgi:hypothetical protein
MKGWGAYELARRASYKFSVIRLMKSFIAEQCGCYPSPH